MKNILSEQNKNKNLKTKKYVVVIVVSLLTAVLPQLVLSNILAGRGEELSSLEKKERFLIRENNKTKEDLAKKTSLYELNKKAQELGLSYQANNVYLELSQEFAFASK